MANNRRKIGPAARGPRKPFAARGGVKAQSKQGSFGLTWLGRRWLQVFEPSAVDTRLARGRSYARSGQVIDVRVETGAVIAEVQGSTLKPYEVVITVKPIADEAWTAILAALAARPALAARLIAGDPPEAVDELFIGAGAPLFPNRLRDIKNQCDCTDWSNPCKHVAAVYYLLCEQMDADPFVLFALRGRSRDDLLAPLAAATAGRSVAPTAPPLPTSPADFWAAPPAAGPPLGDVVPPSVSASLPARLGPFPFWRGDHSLLGTLEPLYRAASIEGLDVFLAQSAGPDGGVGGVGGNGSASSSTPTKPGDRPPTGGHAGSRSGAAGAVDTTAAAGQPPRRRRGRPRGSKNKPRTTTPS